MAALITQDAPALQAALRVFRAERVVVALAELHQERHGSWVAETTAPARHNLPVTRCSYEATCACLCCAACSAQTA